MKIDPRRFFESVAYYGGFFPVANGGLWPEVLRMVLNLSAEDTDAQEMLKSEGVVSEVAYLYWTRLYAFERVFLQGQDDDGVDYASLESGTVLAMDTTDIEDIDIEDESEPNQTAPARSKTLPTAPLRTDTTTKMEEGDYSEVNEDEDDVQSEDDAKLQSETQSQFGDSKRGQLRPNPETLMEMFTARPEHGRPLTWRHIVEVTGVEKIAPQDYTKTPIPRASGRLMGRHREGLLMRRLEKILAEGPDARLRGAALESLVTRTWSKSFFLAIYPTLLDELLRYAQHLIANLQLESVSSHLFNSENGDHDSCFTFLLRISVIFRNLAHASSNVNILSSHPGVVALLSNFASLAPFEMPVSAFQDSISHHTLSDLVRMIPSWCETAIPISLLQEGASETDAKKPTSRLTTHGSEEAPHTSNDAVSIILRLKSSQILSQLADIQFNAMEALCKLVHLMRLSPLASKASLHPLSPIGMELKKCMPIWVDIATSGKHKATLVFIAVETLARISMNSHSRPLWKTIPIESRARLFETLIRYTIVNDEMADWALFACYHLSLNVLDLSLAHALYNHSEIIDHLMLLVAAYGLPSQGSTDAQKAAAYRRHAFAVRSATILHRLAEFVSIRAGMLKHEDILAEIFLRAPSGVADPLFLVFLEMQSPDPSVELVQ